MPSTEREDRASATRYIIWAVLVILIICVAAWTFHVVTSELRGKGDAYAQKNEADNWTKQQAEFNRRYQSIIATDKNIGVAATALKRDPDNTKRQIEYDGLVRNCNTAVGEYNSLAREYLAEQFRDADLPAQINGTDPSTDCQE